MKLCLLVFLFVAAVTLVHAHPCPNGFWSTPRTCGVKRPPCARGHLCIRNTCCVPAVCPPGYRPNPARCTNKRQCGPRDLCGSNKHCCRAPPRCPRGLVGTRTRPTCNRDVICSRSYICIKGRCCKRHRVLDGCPEHT